MLHIYIVKEQNGIKSKTWDNMRPLYRTCQLIGCKISKKGQNSIVYHCHKPLLLDKWPLLQVCYKPPPQKVSPGMPASHVNAFFTRINPWKFGEKKNQRLLKGTTPTEYKKYTVSTH